MKIGFIGGGIATEVVIVYLKRYVSFVSMHDVYVYEDKKFRFNQLLATYEVKLTYPNFNFVRDMDILFLSEKVSDINDAMQQAQNFITDKTIICTMIPGLQIKTVAHYFPKSPIIRMALNFPLIDQQGIIVFSTKWKSRMLDMDQIAPFMTIFNEGGKMLRVDEEVMDIASMIVFGSTFFQTLVLQREVELLSKYGISKEDALQIVSQVRIGTAYQAQAGHNPLEEMKTIANYEGDPLAKKVYDFFYSQKYEEFRSHLESIFKEESDILKQQSKTFNAPFEPPEPEPTEEETGSEVPPEEDVYIMRYRWDDNQ